MRLNLSSKNREILLYLVFGGATTLVNFIAYFAASRGLGFAAWLSAALAWAVAVCFAFVTNKALVFKSGAKGKNGAQQFVMFVSARVLSGIIAAAAMFALVDYLGLNEIVIFTAVQIFVIVFNYVASKWLIFR